MKIRSIGKRWLYLSHRWLGIVLCLFMGMWFFSGVVMMYVGYPKLTPAERLAHLPDLILPEGCCISPQQALAGAGLKPLETTEFRLVMVGDSPYWLVGDARRGQVAVNALTGEAAQSFDGVHALSVAALYAPGSRPRLLETTDGDMFSVSKALDAHRPLHLVAIDDAQGTELYVSSRTGEVIRDTNCTERFWNWSGSILHWLYPLKSLRLDPWRADVIIYLSLFGTVLTLLGIWVGVLRWRFGKPYASTASSSPYRSAWMKWHHISGLAFGLVTLTWIFSGLMSMNPWKIFESGGPRPDYQRLAGIDLEHALPVLAPAVAIEQAGFPVRELSFRLFNGHPYYVLSGADGRSRLLAADERSPQAFERFSDEAIASVGSDLMKGYRVVSIERLDTYDAYYYTRRPHTMTGHVERRLPVIRIAYNDPQHTWLHIDPYSGAVHSRIDDYGRVKRWAFNFLHSWDAFGWTEKRPAWDIGLVLLSLGGFVLCLSGVVIGWRRIARPAGASRSLKNDTPLRTAS